MYFIVLLASLALAIPTFGGSLALFLLFKNWWDDGAAKMIMQMADQSLKTGNPVRLYKINKGALKKVFKLYGTDEFEIAPAGTGMMLYTGTIRHPKHEGELILSIFRTSISGELNISATELGDNPLNEMIEQIKREMTENRAKTPNT